MPTDEAALWTAWLERRDAAAFERLVRPHLGFAAGFARRLGCADADADDVVQRALASLASERRQTPVRVGVRAWIGRSVLSEARMFWRARRRRENREGSVVPAGPSTVNPVDARDEVEALLGALPEDARRALELRYLYDLEYREIAAVLGVSALACRLRVHRAASALRRRFGAHGALLVAALPLRTADASGVSVTAAVSSAPSAATSLLVGGFAMGIAWKGAAVAAVALVVGTAGRLALHPPSATHAAGDPEVAVLHARTDAADSAAAPTLSGRPSSVARAPARAGSPDPGAPESGGSTPGGVPVPLDAAIPPGTASIAGVVRWSDGTPAVGLELALSGWTSIHSVTDAEGRYHIHGEWTIAPRSLVLVGEDELALYLRRVPLEADQRTFLDVVLERGVRVAGRVTAAATGSAVSGALVVMRREGAGADQQAGAAWVRTDADGRWGFEHVPPDEFSWTCEAAGFEFREARVAVRASPVEHDVRLARARQLVVRITDLPPEAAGRRQTVGFRRVSAGSGHSSFDSAAVLQADGTLTLDLPPEGTWDMTIFGDEVVPRFERRLALGPDAPEPLTFTAPRSVALGGVLRDAAGRPMPGARVNLGDALATTDAAGRLRFRAAEPGRHVPRLRLQHGSVALLPVNVPASGPAEVAFAVAGDAELHVTVDDPHHTVALHTATGSQAEESSFVADVPASGDRRVRIPHLAPGVYRLVVGTYSLFEVREVSLAAGQVLDLGLVTVPVAVRVPVRVTSASDAAAPGRASVRMERDLGGTLRNRQAPTPYLELDREGAGWLHGLPVGRFLLVVEAEGAAPAQLEVQVREGLTAPVLIELRRR